MTLALGADTGDVRRKDRGIDAAAFERLREAGLVCGQFALAMRPLCLPLRQPMVQGRGQIRNSSTRIRIDYERCLGVFEDLNRQLTAAMRCAPFESAAPRRLSGRFRLVRRPSKHTG